jgi:hypothetical protein
MPIEYDGFDVGNAVSSGGLLAVCVSRWEIKIIS